MTSGIIADRGIGCPNACSSSNPLNLMFQHVVFYVTLGVAILSCILAIINFKFLDVSLKLFLPFCLFQSAQT